MGMKSVSVTPAQKETSFFFFVFDNNFLKEVESIWLEEGKKIEDGRD